MLFRSYAQAEAASYNYERFFIGGGSERDWVPFLLLGGGYIQPLGDRTWLTVEVNSCLRSNISSMRSTVKKGGPEKFAGCAITTSVATSVRREPLSTEE